MTSKFNLSPGDLISGSDADEALRILQEKEKTGGLKYDELPESPELDNKEPIEEEAPVVKKPEGPLGKSISAQQMEHNKVLAMQNGWKNLPLHLLPSQGLFYPHDTQIAIIAAEVKEIRHFSSIAEGDLIDIESKLNYILDKCSRIMFGDGGVVSYKDLKYEDRFYIVLAIRDLTFIKGENRIVLQPKTDCEKKDCLLANGIELRTGVLSRYEIPDNIMKYYIQETASFSFTIKKTGKKVEMTIPSIGVMERISEFFGSQRRKGVEMDEGFQKIAPFIFPEWRELSDSTIMSKMREIDYWSKEEYSLVFELSEKIKVGTKPHLNLKCNCGAEVAAAITFPSGYRSLFVISDIFSELL
jgi:hypothetical protein